MIQTRDRVAGWQIALDAVIADHRSAPFAWGNADCATLFTQAVFAMTGRDIRAAVPPWFCERTALRGLRVAGFASVSDLCNAHLPRIHPSAALRGDVGLTVEAGPLTCPAIVVGSEAVSMAPDGWVLLPRSALVTAYRVG